MKENVICIQHTQEPCMAKNEGNISYHKISFLFVVSRSVRAESNFFPRAKLLGVLRLKEGETMRRRHMYVEFAWMVGWACPKADSQSFSATDNTSMSHSAQLLKENYSPQKRKAEMKGKANCEMEEAPGLGREADFGSTIILSLYESISNNRTSFFVKNIRLYVPRV